MNLKQALKRISDLERQIDEDLISIKSYCDLGLKQERAVLALRSISLNTCCGQCREAALVAKQALTDIGSPVDGFSEHGK